MKRLTIGSVVTATLLLVGCGGGGGSTSNSSTPTNNEIQKSGKGYYVDSAVAGVDYKCGNETGTTDENGTFTFESNSSCTFTLGEVTLREINASSLEDNVTVLETNETVAQLLQTLDSDGNASNGIQIPQGAKSVVQETLPSLDNLDQDLLESIHDRLKAEHADEYHGRVVDKNQTIEHLNRTKANLEERHIRTSLDIEQEHRDRIDNNSTMEDIMRNREARNSDDNQEHRARVDSNSTMENMIENREGRNADDNQEHSGRLDSNNTIENIMGNREARNSNDTQGHSSNSANSSEQNEEHSGSSSTKITNN